MATTGGLPGHVRRFFWDYPAERLSIATDKDLIIRRLLTHGTWDAICWLRGEVGDKGIKEWLIAHDGRGLAPRQLRFWGLLFDLPVRQVNRWVRTARSGPWDGR